VWRAVACAAAVAALGWTPAKASASTRTDTLEAIHRIENPRDSMRPGRHGELGAYQFRRATWRMYTKRPFEEALNRDTSERVALRHYDWICRGLLRNGMEETPYNIGLAWNGGLMAAVQGRASAAAQDYAERVSNLAHELASVGLAANP
jgi:hypothetical protein